MTNPMTKFAITTHGKSNRILPALLALALLTGAASAQQRTIYHAGGKVVGRSSTDSSGTTTNYVFQRQGDHARDDERQHDDDL
jgi:hypothetical protein